MPDPIGMFLLMVLLIICWYGFMHASKHDEELKESEESEVTENS